MARAVFSTMINRPVDLVFAEVSNFENYPKWSSGAHEVEKTSAGPIAVGTTWRGNGRFLGQRIDIEMEVSEFDPNRKYAWQSKSGPFPVRGTTTFEAIEGGTKVNTTIEAEVGGFFKLAEPLVVNMGKRQFQADLENLKDLMEANAL
jgi:uncharacterized membrane protein